MTAPSRRLAEAILAHAGRMMPPARAVWSAAMAEELHHIEDDRAALRWALGCVAASYMERMNAMKIAGRINRIGAVAPVVMSLTALAIVGVVVSTGWERGLKDEGAAAHIFQLLIAGQIPFMAAYLFTANWKRSFEVAKPLSLQLGALVLAIGSVAVFGL